MVKLMLRKAGGPYIGPRGGTREAKKSTTDSERMIDLLVKGRELPNGWISTYRDGSRHQKQPDGSWLEVTPAGLDPRHRNDPNHWRHQLRAHEHTIRYEIEETARYRMSDGQWHDIQPDATRAALDHHRRRGHSVPDHASPSNMVYMTNDQIEEMRRDGNVVFTHNHPTGGTLSPADIQVAIAANMQEMRACDSLGGAWVLRRPEIEGRSRWPSRGVVEIALEQADLRAMKNAVARMTVIVQAAGGDINDLEAAEGFDKATWGAILKEESYVQFVGSLGKMGLSLEYEADEDGPDDPRRAARGVFYDLPLDRIEGEARRKLGLTKAKPPNRLPGGEGDDTDMSRLDPKQIEMGVQHELEHTDDPDIALEIVVDHLTEDPDYYTKLKRIEKGLPKLGLPLAIRTAVIGPPPNPNREEHPYQGSINYQGILIYVENLAGSTRSGTGANGKKWSTKMRYHYGEIPGTRGADGDAVDVFVGPDPTCPIAFVVHQRSLYEDSSEYSPPGTYDEDKVMLGFATEEAAVRAYMQHFNVKVPTPGVTEIDVEDLRQQIEDGDLAYGTALVKGKALPNGWVSHRKSGYWRKRGPDDWVQLTDEEGKAAVAAQAGKPKKKRPHAATRWERDPTRTFDDLEPGDVCEVGGRRGLFKYTPSSDPIPGLVQVTSVRTGEVESVRKDTVFPVREVEVKEPKKRKAPPAPKRKKPKKGDVVIGDWEGPIGERRETPTETAGPSPRAKKAKPFPRSTAVPGTIHYKLENGEYMLRQVLNERTGRMRYAVHVPEEDRAPAVKEFRKLAHQQARKVARKYGIPIGRESESWHELTAAAALGFWKAISSYAGERPFVPHAIGYVKAEVVAAARSELGRGTPIPDRFMRNVHGYLAAKNRARGKSGRDPTPEQIVRHWSLKKHEVFRGSRTLGSYVVKNEDGTVDVIEQDREECPDEEWHIRDPAGNIVGDPVPGKLKLADAMEALIAGDRIADQDWMIDYPEAAAGSPQGEGTVGTDISEHIDLMSALDQMGSPEKDVLIMTFGIHTDNEMSKVEIADELGITGSSATKRRKVTAIYERALSQIKQIMGAGPKPKPPPEEPKAKPKPRKRYPSHRELEERFGTEAHTAELPAPVQQYHAALRAELFGHKPTGHAAEIARILEKVKRRRGTKAEKKRLVTEFRAQRDRDRERAAGAHGGEAVEPGRARDFGAQGGAPDVSRKPDRSAPIPDWEHGGRPPRARGSGTDYETKVPPLERARYRHVRNADGSRHVVGTWNGHEVKAASEAAAMAKLSRIRNQALTDEYEEYARNAKGDVLLMRDPGSTYEQDRLRGIMLLHGGVR